MTLTFRTRLDGTLIRCEIGTDRPLAAPTLCFSLMAPSRVVSGGTLARRVASYVEVALPDLSPGTVHEVVMDHTRPIYPPRNRAWLPLGAYLRVGRDCLPLPPGTDLGLRQVEGPPALPLDRDRLPLVPQPERWEPAPGTLAFAALAPGQAAAVADLADRLGLAPFEQPGGLPLTVTDDPDLPTDGYRLTIASTGLSVAVGGPSGLHYACITLLSLRETCGGALPCGTITDRPDLAGVGNTLIARGISSASRSSCASLT